MIGHYGHYGLGDAATPGMVVQDALAPFTGEAPQTQAGQGFQALVQALPNIQSTVYQIANPGTLVALSRRQAKLQAKLKAERDPVKRAALEAELGVVANQLAALQGALNRPSQDLTTAVDVRPVSTFSYGWAIGAVVGGVVLFGALGLLLGGRRRSRR